MKHCEALTSSGGRCNAGALEGGLWCYNHDPERAEERKRNASKAGKTGGRGRGFRTTGEIQEIKAAILKLVGDVLEGNVERSSAAVVGNLYNTLLRAVEVERRVKETEELERRLEELERRWGSNVGGRRWGD